MGKTEQIVVIAVLAISVIIVTWQLWSIKVTRNAEKLNGIVSLVKAKNSGHLLPGASKSKYMYISPEATKSKHVVPTMSAFIVPNKVHYIWYKDFDAEFTFYHYLSVLSVHKFQKPEGIYFHTNRRPTGKYWKKCLKLPRFNVVPRQPPKELFGIKLDKAAFETSSANVDRVKILMEEGGIYLDTDVLLVKSLDPLRKHEFVLGEEKADPLLLCSSIILANKNSAFLKLWMEHYLTDRHVKQWAYNSGKVPTILSSRYPDLIHIVRENFQHPSWAELDYLYGMKTFPWREHYAIHLWHSVVKVHDPKKLDISKDSIKTLNSTYGQVARHIYYN